MDNLKELGAIWQNNQSVVLKQKETDLKSSGIISKLKKLEKKYFRIYTAKTIGVSICLIFLSYTLLNLSDINIISKIAFGWILFTMTITMIIYWQKQYNSSKLNFVENSQEFISKTILKLKSQKQITTHLLPAMLGSLIIGINLMYLDLLKEEDTIVRISLHLFVSFFLILVMYLRLKIQKKRFKNDFKPLIEELELIKQKFEDNEKNL